MVTNAVYLFLGHDTVSKDQSLDRIKKEILPPSSQEFNLDIVHGRDTALKDLQEKLLLLPVNAPKRILVIRQSEQLKEESKKYLISYCARPNPTTVLVIDFHGSAYKDAFVSGVSRFAAVMRFREERRSTVFDLARAIDARQAQASLQILHSLLQEGEKPERILGALRSSWERTMSQKQELAKRLRLLLVSDVDIKTGRVKPAFVLERLIVSLCGLRNPPG